MQTGMTDPFITINGGRPPTTTIHDKRDIDYILTWQVPVININTLPHQSIAMSDHLAIMMDIDIQSLFGRKYSALSQPMWRQLTLKNISSKKKYINYITKEWDNNKLFEKADDLYNTALLNPTQINQEDIMTLDNKITNVLLSGEQLCSKPSKNRNPWSPELVLLARTYTYWRQKKVMSRSQQYNWKLLNYFTEINISPTDHYNTDMNYIRDKLHTARWQWIDFKKNSYKKLQQFLSELANDYAQRHNIDAQKALNAIIHSEKSRREFSRIRQILGHKKDRRPLT